ncbi:MAG TPA: calcium-binding protein [Hyphomicrobiales bacterium]|nr:calcium-binding protein [Hyphomicrobiales bacterium]
MTVTTSYSVNTLNNVPVGDFTEAPDSGGLSGGGWATTVYDFARGFFVLYGFNPDGTEAFNIPVGDSSGSVATSPLDGSLHSYGGWTSSSGGAYLGIIEEEENIEDGSVTYSYQSSTIYNLYSTKNSQADVAAEQNPILYSPRVVLAWQHDYGSGDHDVMLAIRNSDGSGSTTTLSVDTSTADDEAPSVAFAGSGHILVTWNRIGAGGDTDLWQATYDRDGVILAAAHAVDTTGSVNADPSVAAGADGAFLTAYQADQSNGDLDIATIFQAADGNTLTRASASTMPGIDEQPAAAYLDGVFGVAFTHTILDLGAVRDQDIYLSLFDAATGEALTAPAHPIAIDIDGNHLTSDPSLTALAGGKFLVSYFDETDGVVRDKVMQLVETIAGDGDANVLTSRSNGISNISGGDGDDTIRASAAVDHLSGGNGNDSFAVEIGTAADVDGGAGNDTVSFFAPPNYTIGVIVNLANSDPQSTGGGTISLTGVENLTGGNGADTLVGNSGANILDDGGNQSAGGGRDTLIGGAGNDTYVVGDAATLVVEASADGGVDLVQSTRTFTLPNFVENLTLLGIGDLNGTGNSLANVLTGNDGDNVLTGGKGNDTYVVGPGDTVVEAADGGTDTVRSAGSFTLGDFVENLTLTGSADIDGTGNSLDNTLIGNAGKNVLRGGTGDDTYVVGSGDTVVEAASGGHDTVDASVSFSIGGLFVEDIVLTGSGNINATGNSLANALTGNAGKNILDGGTGADTMTGGAGDDIFIVDNALDRVIETAGGGTDTVKAAVSFALAGTEVENLVLTGGGNLDATGNALANSLTGTAGKNVLSGWGGGDVLNGWGGDDTLNGGAGKDVMRGGNGDDTYVVDDAGDRVVEAKNGGTDTVKAAVSFSLAGSQVENLVLTGHGNTHATGNALANSLTGNAGKNVLDGGAGADTMTGGRGSDTFVFSTKLGAANVDHIVDFAAGGAAHDTIRLAHSVFHALPVGALAATAFKDVAAKAEDANDRILYNHKTGVLSYDDDGAGGDAAVKIAVLNNHADLTHADFLIA